MRNLINILTASLTLLAFGCTDPNAIAAECSPGQVQDCSEERPDYSLQTAEDISRVCNEGCLHVGSLSVGRLEGVTSLDVFNYLESILDLVSSRPIDLTVWDGFSSLQRLGQARIEGSLALEEIRGFDTLEKVDSRMDLDSHPELRAITGFQSLRQVGEIQQPLDEYLPTEQRYRLQISNADKLTDLSGFSNLEVVNHFALRYLGALPTMEDFGSLRETKHFILYDLASLESLEGLASMEHIHQGARFLDLPNLKRCEIEAFLEGLESQPIDLKIERVNEAPCD